MNILKKGLTIPLHQRQRSKKSKNDNWWTPWWLFRCLCAIYKFKPELDVCADGKNTKCISFFTKKDNALERNWLLEDSDGAIYVVDIWCNPPNSQLGAFIRKAFEQHRKFGMRIMMIVPTNVMSSDAWWDGVEIPKDEGFKIKYKPIYHRIEFLDKGKKPESSARNAYLVVIWG